MSTTRKKLFVRHSGLAMESSHGNSGSSRISDEPKDDTKLHQVKGIDVSMTPCGSCEGCCVTKDCGTRCDNCIQNYIQTEIENNPNHNILPCLKRMCHQKYIPKKEQLKYPMLRVDVQQVNVGARNVKNGDGKEEIALSNEQKIERKKDANNNNNKVLRSTSKESTIIKSSSTTENDNLCKPENDGYKPMNVMNSNLCQLNSAAFPSPRQSQMKVKVRVFKSDSELHIIDMPKLSNSASIEKKSEPFELVDSNMYRTCACSELCQTDSCACVGYREECKDSCQCGDSCSNKGLTVGEEKEVFLAPSGVHGTGCFADEDIKEGEFVGEYVGEIISRDDAKRSRIQSEFLFTTGDKNFVIDASRFGSKLTRMNHKDEKSGANSEFRLKRVRGEWRVGVWALQDVSEGVELFANYGDHYWV